jgi:hypothetical protein
MMHKLSTGLANRIPDCQARPNGLYSTTQKAAVEDVLASWTRTRVTFERGERPSSSSSLVWQWRRRRRPGSRVGIGSDGRIREGIRVAVSNLWKFSVTRAGVATVMSLGILGSILYCTETKILC